MKKIKKILNLTQIRQNIKRLTKKQTEHVTSYTKLINDPPTEPKLISTKALTKDL